MGLKEHAEFVGARAAQRTYRIKHGLSEADLNDNTWESKEAARQEEIRKWKLEQKRLKKGKAGRREKGKHSTPNIQHSTSKERKANVQKSKAKDHGLKNMAKGTRLRCATARQEGQMAKQKCAKRAVKAGKSRLIVPNPSAPSFAKATEGRDCGIRSAECPKAAKYEQQRPNVGLAKETKGLKTEEFADRKMGDGDWQGYDEEVNLSRPCETGATNDVTDGGNEPGRETGVPTAENPGESRAKPNVGLAIDPATIKTNQGQTTDWDASNQIYWTKEELESLAELRRRRQDGGNARESNLRKATGTDLTDTTDGEAGATTGTSETSAPAVAPATAPEPKLTARERADNARLQMLTCTRPFDLAELERLYAEAKKEEQ